MGALTAQRITVLTWAFAAILCGSIGLASFKFGRDALSQRFAASPAQLLPPGGDVATTASIPGRIGVMPSVNGRTVTGHQEVETAQMETMQRELVALRRRLSALAEQNLSYSRRIAALEEQGQAEMESPDTPSDSAPMAQPAPVPGTVRSAAPAAARKSDPDPAKTTAPAAPPKSSAAAQGEPAARLNPTAKDKDQAIRSRIEAVPAPETISANEARVQQQLYHTGQAALAAARRVETPPGDYAPVRIVEAPKPLPAPGPEPVATGSIAPTETPEPEVALPVVISPSAPVGRTSGAGQSKIRQSDFGVVVGRYDTLEDASKAWAEFSTQNEERMRDLRPIVMKSDLEGAGFNLLAGPFGNAADAAVACLRLLEVTGSCHPALYIGDPLPETAMSRR